MSFTGKVKAGSWAVKRYSSSVKQSAAGGLPSGRGLSPPALQPIVDWVESKTVMLMKEHPLARDVPWMVSALRKPSDFEACGGIGLRCWAGAARITIFLDILSVMVRILSIRRQILSIVISE
ncbi:hypothetical protein DP120_12475 [Planococcus halotolerans]|uniref:Uncharacterized protein n=1 Tax=Planococcus halotolerans TaxID=2233542 RepID=A0A365KR78_9BACL|nr:hypothetical protein DP120_12475 [Planococcus halotolerans]